MPDSPIKPSMEVLFGKLEEIQWALRENLANLQEKLALLESPQLQDTLTSYLKAAENRANSLEVEVTELREELRAIKELLGFNLQKCNLEKP